jgi:hypothetical protein
VSAILPNYGRMMRFLILSIQISTTCLVLLWVLIGS